MSQENRAIVVVKDVHKIYQETKVPVKALRGVTLEISKGEFTAIVGPSGSGKTTLLNIIGGLDRPTSGTVQVDDVDIGQLSAGQLIDFRREHIGFVFQSFNLIPVLTAKENVEFVMLLQGADRKMRDARAMELLEAVGLGDRTGNRPTELSGGQQQRVAVARALAAKPAFVLADEPTASLDSAAAATLLDIMSQLNEELGMTFIFSTHDQRVIDRARRVITIEDGMVVKDVWQ